MGMINLKSFEDFVVKYAQESLKIHNRLNEGVEFEKNIYGKIINITNQRAFNFPIFHNGIHFNLMTINELLDNNGTHTAYL